MAISQHTRHVMDRRRTERSAQDTSASSAPQSESINDLQFPRPEVRESAGQPTRLAPDHIPPLVPRDLPAELRALYFPQERHPIGKTQREMKGGSATRSNDHSTLEVAPSAPQAETPTQPTPNRGIIYERRPNTCDAAPVPEYNKLFERYGERYNLDPYLLAAVSNVESSYNPQAVSKKGAKGLMQLTTETAQDMGVRNPFNPEESVRGGAKYLRQLIDRFGDLEHALAAYNAGPGNVEKHGGVPPFAETRNYLEKVLDTYRNFRS